MVMKSITESDDPKRDMPYTAKAEPKREKLRSDKDEPMKT
jgi:hypothetical protein